MEKITIGDYEIVLTGKMDGSVHDMGHWTHKEFYNIQQIHSDIVYFVSEKKVGRDENIKGDAIVSCVGNIGVYTADCNPIVIMGKNYYAVVHGSWKTLKKGIIEKTVKNLYRQGETTVDIKVYIGPSIRKAVYEVGFEFYKYFSSDFLEERSGHLYLDLLKYILHIFYKLGTKKKDILIHLDCTYEQNKKWYSRRKDKTKERNFCGVKKN